MSREAGLNKAPDAFRTISEVAEELDLPQHVLRFWESRFPQIKPLKRGGGRRYYRPEDIDLLRGIRRLLYSDGYTIKGVQRILREQGARIVQSVGQGQEMSLAAALLDEAGDGDQLDGAVAADIVAPPDSPGRWDPDEEEDGRTTAPAPPRPKNGRIAKVNSPESVAGLDAGPANQGQIGIQRGAVNSGGTNRVAVNNGGAGIAADHEIPVRVAATAAPSAMAAPDLDRLKRALTDLEACRRLLEKAIEGR